MNTDVFQNLLPFLDQLCWSLMFPLMVLYLVLGLDDLFIDLYALLHRLKPKTLSTETFTALKHHPQKKIAIMVAAWQEAGVIKRMIQGNLERLDYKNAHFFLGVYPNDKDTLKEASELSHQHSNVHVVINSEQGPTSKGQMINQIAQQILEVETDLDEKFDALMIHDCEDVMHPDSLTVINDGLSKHDFLQIPVFSFSIPFYRLVAGTYQDEFTEILTKDQLVRHHLGAPFPSSGVGTALSRKLVLQILEHNNDTLLNPGSLTEDYELGMRASQYDCAYAFLCYKKTLADGNKEFIATREYFPMQLKKAIKQKSRWVIGIAIQGTLNLGWKGSLKHKYFLYRDRKGPISNLTGLTGLLIVCYFSLRYLFAPNIFTHQFPFDAWMLWASAFNSILMLNRLAQRMRCIFRVHGLLAMLTVPFRIPVGILINALASLKAVLQYSKHLLLGEALQWSKTEHVLPVEFGNKKEAPAT